MTVKKLCTCMQQQCHPRNEKRNANVKVNEKIVGIRHHEDGS